MRTRVSAVLLLALLAASAAAQRPFDDLPKGPVGFIDKTGKVVIEARFAYAREFSEGLAPVVAGTERGYIDPQGKMVISNPQFEDLYPFHDGLARVKVGGKWGFIDKTGHWVVSPQFEIAEDFSEGLALVAAPRADNPPNAKKPKFGYGYIDTSGKMAIPPQFYEAHSFSDGLAMVRRQGGQIKIETDAHSIKYYREEDLAGYIDKSGAFVIPQLFTQAMSFSEGLACVQMALGNAGYIDRSGKLVFTTAHWAADPFGGISVDAANFHEGLAFADTKGGFVHVSKWGFVDTKGNVVTTLDANKASHFSEGLAAIGKGKLHFTYGFIDRTGAVVIPLQFKAVSDFSDGLAAVKIDKTWGYIDKTGKLVIPPQFSWAEPFTEGLARVSMGK